ncbi:MAG: phosphatidylserine/phosphatidylglycerophosphate/cardiolipin synthase family protein [Gaiellaceae bacterium]
MDDAITLRTLTDGGQTPDEVAHLAAGFIGAARTSLDLAQYDFHLLPETAAIVAGAIRDAAARGVAVRLLYNVDHRHPIPVPPPPEPDAQLISSLGVPAKAIAGVPDLMHHKYVVRDREAVWTGSANWTDESWTRQENVLLTVGSPALAELFAANFQALWDRELVETSGFEEPRPLEIGGIRARAWFCPGHGEELAHRIAKRIGCARRRVRICSPVITAAPVLAALAQAASEGRIELGGCIDAPQMHGVVHQWTVNGNVSWKLPLLRRALARGFSGKPSTPWEPQGSLHDFMHAKVSVCDDVVFLGSYNLSRSGERNAENVVELEDAALAGRLSEFVESVTALYPPARLD